MTGSMPVAVLHYSITNTTTKGSTMSNESNEPIVIEDSHYASEAERLAQDPAIRAMAATLPAGVDTTSWDFMRKANAEAHRRNVQGIESIGGVARAISLIVNGE